MFFLSRTMHCFIALLFIAGKTAYGQQKDIDSLKIILAKTTKDDTNKVNTLNQIAFNYYSVNISQLKLYSNQAIQLSLKLKFDKGTALAYKNIGLGYLGSNADPAALIYFNKSLTIYNKLGDKVSSSRILNNIGYYYGRIKDTEHELSYLKKALNQVRGLNKITIETTIMGNIGNSFEGDNKPDSALKYYQVAYNELLKVNQANSSITAYSNLASVYLKLKQYDKSLFFGNKVLKMISLNNNYRPKDLAAIYLTLGQLNYQLKNYDRSRIFFKQSLDLGNRIGNPETITGVYHGYYQLDSVKGKYLSALKNYNQYVRLNDSLINANKSRVVSLYEAKFDLQKEADENDLLKIEQEKNQSIISHQHTTEVILVLGLIIIAIGLVYLIRINNQAKHQSTIINQQNKVLENNNLVKDKLFSVVSHDLRSPITQVIGLLNLWEDGEMKVEEMSALTPVVKNSVVQTLDLLDNLLIWSNNQLQGFNFNPVQFDLGNLVDINLRGLKTSYTQKNLRIKNSVEPGTMVYADSEMIKIVLRNLISNAIKFTPDTGSISISSTIENSFVVIVVKDTGIGIKAADMAKIFSFTSHTTLGTANEKGTGIGLKICKDFIELNKGSIRMESVENQGSSFFVSLPNTGLG